MAAVAVTATRVLISGAGSAIVNGVYAQREASTIPAAFARVCHSSGWDAAETWTRLDEQRAWWESPNGSYLYFNGADKLWWLDSGETGLGLYVSGAAGAAPPSAGWQRIGRGALPLPTLAVEDSEAGGEL
jgi:hypothetical protein